MSLSARWPLLERSPAFGPYFSARTISAFGSAFGTIAVTFAAIEAGLGAAGLSIVLAATALPSLALMLVGGVVGDRVPRRLVLMSADVVMGLAQLASAALYFAGQLDVVALASLQFVRGAAYAFFAPASTGMLPERVAVADLQQANTVLGLARNIANIVGPPCAGIVIAVWDPGVALTVDAASFLVSAMLVLRLPRDGPRSAETARSSFRTDLREGWQEFRGRAWVWKMVVSFALYQGTVLPVINVLGPILVSGDSDGATRWAIVLSARAAGSLLGGLVLLRWRPHNPLVASTALMLLDTPFIIALALGAPLWCVVPLALVSAGGLVSANTLWETTLQRRIPPESISRISSYDWAGSLSMSPLGILFVGLAASTAPVAGVVLAVAVLHVATRGTLVFSKSLREEQPNPAAS